MFCCNDCKGKFSPLCGILCGFAKTMDAFATLVWLFSSVHTPHVDRQLAGCDAWKATLWTSVRLFPRVGHLVFCKGIFKMWGKVALVTLVGLFPRVGQNEWANVFLRYKLDWRIYCIVHNCATYPQNEWALGKCLSKSPGWLNELMHCAHLCLFSPMWIFMCILRSVARVNDLLHWALPFFQNGLLCDSLDFQLGQMFSCIYHIDKGSFHCCGLSLVVELSGRIIAN